MTRLLYIANVRIPTEKAHGLQIVQMCEAFVTAGADVTLWVAARHNTPAMTAIGDPFAYYGVAQHFSLRRLPTLDLLPLVPGRTDAVARAIFYLQLLTFIVSVALRLLVVRPDIVYTRDARVARVAEVLLPGRVVYEVHQLARGHAGVRTQRAVLRCARAVVPITARLQVDLLNLLNVDADDRFLVAHDGVRAARFEDIPDAATARETIGWPHEAFIVGYIGRLHTMNQEKGVGTLIQALVGVPDVTLALVGGPDDMVATYREQWLTLGLPPERFLYQPHVPPDAVPLHMAALDVCAMPRPFTTHFAYHTSPLKLFEYMASGRAIVATDLPGWADVVTDNVNALLVPPSDVPALVAALRRLQADPALRERLGTQAREDALACYTWGARAQRILEHVNRCYAWPQS